MVAENMLVDIEVEVPSLDRVLELAYSYQADPTSQDLAKEHNDLMNSVERIIDREIPLETKIKIAILDTLLQERGWVKGEDGRYGLR